ncbi:CBS domain-containing protein [Pseudonocardia bannensis]|uniref:CBS domain-containing protein n=1 Tax=Pseudonocardia bannensis TaxID=630973 RepID=A0A848DEW4_9PSEU|nr:CBS domain-containing protein [Pseudonocardia bannensis]NMH91115.1 CBS domain-containing protein [Pseudonocardia bannensis]
MKIADILDAKGRTVHTALPWITVAEAVARLNRHRIGALLACDADRKICGILSERDIMRGLGRYGSELLDMKIDDVMTHHPATVSPEETVAQAMAQMTRGRYRHLPVVDQGAVVGIVSIGDLVKHRVKEMELETGVLRDAVIARY